VTRSCVDHGAIVVAELVEVLRGPWEVVQRGMGVDRGTVQGVVSIGDGSESVQIRMGWQ